MPTPTIPAGNLFMNATTYTGTGATLSVTNGAAGQAFQPDMVWIKSRSNALNHNLYDSVRGVQKVLSSNVTSAENYAGTGDLTAFDSNGFTVQQTANYQLSQSGYTYVGWNWKAGGTAVTNTSGTISSQVSANTTSGFSVVTFTAGSGNQTVGHGLGVAPSMVILKRRNSTSAWLTYHSSLSSPATSFLELNTTSAVQSASPFWGASGVTSTTFGTSDNATINGSTYVAYCWAPIAGYSAFGSYTGNGSSDGPFIYTGFRPRFVLIKRTDGGTANWYLLDSARSPYNLSVNMLFPNLSAGEVTTAEDNQDFLSNGFKVRTSNQESNINGGTYIYMAFAENPFKYANAR
jgi:hypothetical protein